MNTKFAPRNKRMWAYVIDCLLTFPITLAIAFVTFFVFEDISDFTITILSIVVAVGIEVIQLMIFGGRNIGKVIMKLRVVDKDTHSAPSLGACIKRSLALYGGMQLAGLITSAGSIVYACVGMAQSQKNAYSQSFWDMCANTTVIDES